MIRYDFASDFPIKDKKSLDGIVFPAIQLNFPGGETLSKKVKHIIAFPFGERIRISIYLESQAQVPLELNMLHSHVVKCFRAAAEQVKAREHAEAEPASLKMLCVGMKSNTSIVRDAEKLKDVK